MKRSFILIYTVIFLCIAVNTAHANTGFATRSDALNLILSHVSLETSANLTLLAPYIDAQDLTPEEKENFAYAVELGVIQGYEDSSLRPHEFISRAELATLLFRMSSYLEAYPKFGNFSGKFYDAASWNGDALKFCVEHGFMMGYGDSMFGSADFVTIQQLEIIDRRMTKGLTSIERHQFLSYNGAISLNMEKVLADFAMRNDALDYSQFLCQYGGEQLWQPDDAWRRQSVEQYQTYVDLVHAFDYTECNTEEKAQKRAEQVYHIWETWIPQGYQEAFQDLQEKQIRKDAFFLVKPDCVGESFGFPTIMREAKGVEYFIYYQAPQEYLPEGIELGKWYVREVDFRFKVHSSARVQSDFSIYGVAHQVTDEFLN